MDLHEAEVPLTTQRLRELMLWHGTDEGNLPPAATLVNLSRDTIAALTQLVHARAQLTQMRAALADLFWNSQSSEIRTALLAALGAPPDSPAVAEELPALGWQASASGLPLPSLANDSQVSSWQQRAMS